MCVAAMSVAHADAVKVGLHETGGVHVESGTVTQSDPVVLGDKAKFYKTGAGELVLPLANVNRQRDYSLAALDGKMTISAGDDSTVDVSQPPAVLSLLTDDDSFNSNIFHIPLLFYYFLVDFP